MNGQVGAAIEVKIGPASVYPDKRRMRIDIAPVIEPEIAGHAGEDHQVGPRQRFPSPMADEEGWLRPRSPRAIPVR